VSCFESRNREANLSKAVHWLNVSYSVRAWLCTESILAFFGRGLQCELQNAFRQQLREAAPIGRWETDWKAQGKYPVFLGSGRNL
jgi:hypothetical protein